MLIKINLLTLISEKRFVTAYFFDKDSKIVLAQNYFDQKQSDLESLHNLICILEAEVLYIELGQEGDEAQLHLLNKDGEVVKTKISLKTAICFSRLYEYPIFIQHELLYKDGIMVTKKLIEDTLRY